ncbi:hypothetical protein GCM10011490_08060 [Pseudoclavibacter endophyticus]|uniref:Uncharacterized protein n=1 Tax=Pseudoclavibacter endophyticus TaxID=1778590 RepID=A0A6H9WFP6_9MICO|nr:hypothetical protein [Pseudoclavibacter endophyticus]KAB1649722.1 hypothetical protein F8O04_05655 [Pseudoclavibacter endophyticus]GGA60269.1 hypothetical protein GCM10011490_08060 [Pseudoclavibacter endophyticus]
MSEETQHPQWFIAADGTVFQSWPPGPDNDRLKYVRYTTNRRLQLSDLYALDERLNGFHSSFNRRSYVLIALAVVVVIAIALMWLFLPQFGVGTGVLVALTVVLAVMLLLMWPIARAITGGSRAGFDRLYLDAGFESSEPTVLKDSEAQTLIDAPGTVAGRRGGGAER